MKENIYKNLLRKIRQKYFHKKCWLVLLSVSVKWRV